MRAGRYRLIVFDWDGTLMDSARKIVNCFQSAAVDTGLPVPAADNVRGIIGLGLREALVQLFPAAEEPDLESVASSYRDHFVERDQTAMPLFPGVKEGLGMLRAEQFHLAVATGKARRGLDRVLDETGMRDLFSTTRCVDESKSKPDPEMLLDILEQTGFGPEESLMVGDTTFDLRMAAAAGIDSLAVGYGAHPVAPLLKENPRACANDFNEVVQWIRES